MRRFGSKEEMEVYIIKSIRDLNSVCVDSGKVDSVAYVKGVMKFTQELHPSDAYQVIKNYIIPKKNEHVQWVKLHDIELYKEFSAYYFDECKKSYDHDNANATNIDVDMAVTRAYGITVRMIGKMSTDSDERFNKIAMAINRIEEQIGLSITNFKEDNNDTKQTDVQGD